MEGNQPHINTLQTLIQLLKIDKNYKQAIKHGTTNYSITQYKINKLRLEQIPQLVNLIEVNYINLEKQSQQIGEKKKNSWLANQLKLFVWMAVCHSYLINKPLEEYDQHQWQFFTNILTRKTAHDLDFQTKSLFKNYKGNKEKWDDEEQLLLKTILQDEKYQNKWNQISRLMYFQSNKKYYRSSQKCREYWFNHLDDRLNKSAWTIEEDLRLVGELLTYGFKWSKLTQVIESTWGYRRTQHMVKNRTKLLCRKYGYKDEKQQGCMKQLKMIEKKLREQKQKHRQQSSFTMINEVKQQQSAQQKSFFFNPNNVGNNGNNAFERKQIGVLMNNNHQQKILCIALVNKKSETMLKQADNNHVLRQMSIVRDKIMSEQFLKSQQYAVTMEKIPIARGKHELNKHNNDDNESYSSYSQSQSSDYSQSTVKGSKQNKGKNNNGKNKSRKAKRPIKKVCKKLSQQSQQQYSQGSQQSQQLQQQSQQSSQQPTLRHQASNRRNVIILYQGGKNNNQRIQQQQSSQQQYGQHHNNESSSSSQIVIGQHVDQEQQEQKHNRQYDRQSQQNDKEDYYYDEYNIIERVPDQQQIDLNQDIQFQHDTHGGKMRQRVTHQLAKYFPTDNTN